MKLGSVNFKNYNFPRLGSWQLLSLQSNHHSQVQSNHHSPTVDGQSHSRRQSCKLNAKHVWSGILIVIYWIRAISVKLSSLMPSSFLKWLVARRRRCFSFLDLKTDQLIPVIYRFAEISLSSHRIDLQYFLL